MLEKNRITICTKDEKGNIIKNQGNMLLGGVGVWNLGQKFGIHQ
jgi:hypothetical protein